MREAKCTGLRLQGILVETDGTGARQNLMELCARLGGPFLDVAQVKKLMLRHDGCVALKANTWRESTFTVLQSLPVEQRGAYCVLKTVELVYLQCPSATDLIIGSSYRDRYLMNTVSRTHDYMLEHLKEKLINERLARHRISPNLVQRLFTAVIWSAGTSVLASQTD